MQNRDLPDEVKQRIADLIEAMQRHQIWAIEDHEIEGPAFPNGERQPYRLKLIGAVLLED